MYISQRFTVKFILSTVRILLNFSTFGTLNFFVYKYRKHLTFLDGKVLKEINHIPTKECIHNRNWDVYNIQRSTRRCIGCTSLYDIQTGREMSNVLNYELAQGL